MPQLDDAVAARVPKLEITNQVITIFGGPLTSSAG